MDKTTINLGDRSYPVYVGWNINMRSIFSKVSNRFAIITNPLINKLYGYRVESENSVFLEVPDKENSKSLRLVKSLYSRLLNHGLDRTSCIVGFGGGVIGDLAGFVAATYMRGVPLVQIPTTLLAQVDSAIGGKVAIDLPQGKNLVGVFYQPKLVISDVETLQTLPTKELKSGLAEVVKYGVISDHLLFEILEKDFNKVLQRDKKILLEIVKRCTKIKAKIVEKDETEKGRRVILNFGHTLGHAIETVTNYKYKHGEAIAIGMVFAANLAVKVGMLDRGEAERIASLLYNIGLPVEISLSRSKISKIIKIIGHDKKMREGKLRFVLPESIGRVVYQDIPLPILKRELLKI
jgi:3-dehydroquinate synthase